MTKTSGTYRIRLFTTDKAVVGLDGKTVFDSKNPQEKPISLLKGVHSIRIEYQKTEGDSMELHLIWMPPNQNQWEVVPPTAFGKISKN